MRAAALGSIIISELLIIALFALDISASSLSLFSTMVVVVLVAFSSSALLRNSKSMKLTKNYTISGIIGLIAGIAYFIWSADNLEAMVLWLKNFGIYFLLIFIFICSLILFFSNKNTDHGIKPKVD